MGKETGIAWCDSTFSSWWGCTKVAEATACADCYAEIVDKRTGQSHWGLGAPRKLLSENARKAPYNWNRAHDKFYAEHGRHHRVFTSSMGDVFDNEVPEEWRQNHYKVMEECNLLEWQICTKRITNLPKMIPTAWITRGWPQHIGVLITVVTQAESDRDVPRLLEIKKELGIPWVGISCEPMQEDIDWKCLRKYNPLGKPWINALTGVVTKGGLPRSPDHCGFNISTQVSPPEMESLDVIIVGGKSGSNWNDRPFLLDWARNTRDQCASNGVSFFMKQVAAFRPNDSMIPDDLMIRQWPKGH
jgi:protein gp37